MLTPDALKYFIEYPRFGVIVEWHQFNLLLFESVSPDCLEINDHPNKQKLSYCTI